MKTQSFENTIFWERILVNSCISLLMRVGTEILGGSVPVCYVLQSVFGRPYFGIRKHRMNRASHSHWGCKATWKRITSGFRVATRVPRYLSLRQQNLDNRSLKNLNFSLTGTRSSFPSFIHYYYCFISLLSISSIALYQFLLTVQVIGILYSINFYSEIRRIERIKRTMPATLWKLTQRKHGQRFVIIHYT